MGPHILREVSTPQVRSQPTLTGLAVYTERRTLVMAALGFAAGLPFLLIFDTLSAWLRQVGLSLQVIGFFSLATLISSFKFLWAPMIDRATVPVLTGWLGHRRSWMLLCQMAIVVGLALLSVQSPTTNLATMATLAVFVGFCSATQDIVIDAWRIEVADDARHGAMAAAYQWGYRGAMIVAGAAPLFLAEAYNWNVSYAAMTALMALATLATLAAPREADHTLRDTHVTSVPAHPMRDTWEWVVRLAILGLGALLLGSGLTASASVLASIVAGLGATGLSATLVDAWKPPSGVWFQFGSVLLGFVVVIVAVLPVPGVRTRPGAYLMASLGDPLDRKSTRLNSSH